jgi:GAF domain-containing protein
LQPRASAPRTVPRMRSRCYLAALLALQLRAPRSTELSSQQARSLDRGGPIRSARRWCLGPSGLYEPHNSSFTRSHSVDENDPALVAMWARRVVADIQTLGSALPGVLAFPMIVRGELIGALVCGNKEHAEAYAPDEIQSLRNVAAAVGHALDGLRVRELEERVRFLERAQLRNA